MTFELSAVQIRPASGHDALCIGVLATQVFLDTYATGGIRATVAREVLNAFSTSSCAAFLAQPQTRVLLAEYQSHLVGFAQVTLRAQHELAPAGIQAELFRLYVQEPFTGRGVGAVLLGAAEALLCEHGVGTVWLTPWVHNHRALHFYAKHGYHDFGSTPYTFEDESHENRLLAKSIGANDPR